MVVEFASDWAILSFPNKSGIAPNNPEKRFAARSCSAADMVVEFVSDWAILSFPNKSGIAPNNPEKRFAARSCSAADMVVEFASDWAILSFPNKSGIAPNNPEKRFAARSCSAVSCSLVSAVSLVGNPNATVVKITKKIHSFISSSFPSQLIKLAKK